MNRETIKQLELVRDALIGIDRHTSRTVSVYVNAAQLQVEFAIRQATEELFRIPFSERK